MVYIPYQIVPTQNPDPLWLWVAYYEQGVSEVSGRGSSQRILEYLHSCSQEAGGNLGNWALSRDETQWCSAFVNWCLDQATLMSDRYVWQGTKSAGARSWLRWSRGYRLSGPRSGAITVIRSGGSNSGCHVGFYFDDIHRSGYFRMLGGNQGNTVSIARKSESAVIGHFWPMTSILV